jgi:hypothetical protein
MNICGLRLGWKDNAKSGHNEIIFEDDNCVELSKSRLRFWCRVSVNSVINL